MIFIAEVIFIWCVCVCVCVCVQCISTCVINVTGSFSAPVVNVGLEFSVRSPDGDITQVLNLTVRQSRKSLTISDQVLVQVG